MNCLYFSKCFSYYSLRLIIRLFISLHVAAPIPITVVLSGGLGCIKTFCSGDIALFARPATMTQVSKLSLHTIHTAIHVKQTS